jgi:hypothetical protein
MPLEEPNIPGCHCGRRGVLYALAAASRRLPCEATLGRLCDSPGRTADRAGRRARRGLRSKPRASSIARTVSKVGFPSPDVSRRRTAAGLEPVARASAALEMPASSRALSTRASNSCTRAIARISRSYVARNSGSRRFSARRRSNSDDSAAMLISAASVAFMQHLVKGKGIAVSRRACYCYARALPTPLPDALTDGYRRMMSARVVLVCVQQDGRAQHFSPPDARSCSHPATQRQQVGRLSCCRICIYQHV